MKEKKKFYKTNKFWILIIFIIVISAFVIYHIIEGNKTKKAFSNIGNGASDYYKELEKSNSHTDDFSYNYTTREVEFHPSNITLEMYNRINDGMTENEVISILGNGRKSDGENTYMIDWGELDMSTGYHIQIIFDSSNKTVLSKNQVGLQ